MTLPGARLGAGALLVCALACDPATKPSSQPKTTHPSAGEGSAGGCVGADEVALTGDVWARFEGLACPWIVTLDGAGALELVSLERGRAPARGRAPTGCDAARCLVSGVEGAAGPVLAIERQHPDHERGRGGEAPDMAWVGARFGDALAFTPIWLGDHAHGDSTDLGPVYALAPEVCDAALVLRAVNRLPVALGERVPAVVRAAEGEYRVEGGGAEGATLRRVGDAPATPCAPLELELP